MHPREVLNRLKWCEKTLERATVTIVHRGAPADIKEIAGNRIKRLGRGFMTVEQPGGEVEIPYHRIVKIALNGKVVWERS